ncbi:trichohyalin-like isoform X2 [Haliotis rufescens]|uniref:trichohyalin-like isoform X2 n=1 Tax=Haliotis rufescens TaxID=6454 RepID=UPI001EAFBE41|nr:trichohyalin-like isoform X2 [Haliotis rufescens]
MEEVVCAVCVQFEPQTWRKSLCKNCFHGLEEHTEEVDGTPAVTQKDEPDKKEKKNTGAKTLETGKEKQATLKTGKDSKLASASISKTSPKSSTKTTTVTLSSKFGSALSKSTDNGKTDTGKAAGKLTSVSSKSTSEATKRVLGSVGKQTTDVKIAGKVTGTDKKQNGTDIKLKTFGSKESNSSVKDSPVPKLGNKSGETKTGVAKAPQPSEPAQVSKSDNNKSAGSSSRFANAGGVNKVKHLLRSFGSGDEPADAHEEKKELSDLDKHATRTESDVTAKCQASEGSHVTAKTLVIGKEKESVSTSTSKTVHASASSSKTVKVVATGRSDDGSSGSGRKSPSITISLRGGVADIKVGKSESRAKVAGKLDEGHGERDKGVERELQQLKAKEQEFLELKAKEKELVAKEKEFKELKAREHELKEVRAKERELKAKEKEFKDLLAKEKGQDKVKCKEQEIRDKEHEIQNLKIKEKELNELKAKENDIKVKENEIRKQEENLAGLKAKLAKMEEKCKKLEEENRSLKQVSVHDKKEDMEKLLGDLRRQLSSMEDRCVKLEGDNIGLMAGLKEKEEGLKKACHGSSMELVALSQKFRDSEKDVGEVEEENAKLKCEIREIRDEMEEMYDTFRENEVDEFRDMQKELEITAKNCRILQFKLRKSERRIEQVEADKTLYEERMRLLQNQCESEDTRAHVRKVEDELQMAKEVSVRLHDELDMLDDKRSKAEEDNRHLTELLEQADKKQFRMEMEIDKLRDQIMDLKQELKYAGNRQESSDRKTMLGSVGKQSSSEYDVSQVMRDLYDSIERENDLKEQLRFTEEETKMMRKKLAEMEEENEGLNMQIRKMSRSNKRRELKEKERFIKESEDNDSDTDSSGDIDLKIQCELLEQEISVSRKKISDVEQDNENIREEVKFLQERLEEKTQLLNIKPEPSSPNAYYEDKIKQMTIETDDLKWKIIEKEREIERLCAQMNFIQHSHRQQQGKLKKSKSLDSDYQEVVDLRRQLEHLAQEAGATEERLVQVVIQNERVSSENERLKLQLSRQIPSIQADDAAVENIELKDKVKKLEDDNHSFQDRIKTLTESLQTLTKEPRSLSAELPHIPQSGTSPLPRDPTKHLESIQEENSELRRKMAELESTSSRRISEETIQKTDDQKAVADDNSTAMDKDPEDMSRLQLVEKVLDLEDEILDLKSVIKHKELEREDVEREVTSLKDHIDETSDIWRKKEVELEQDLAMLHDKNSVLSNLLEIVTERADKAEQELEAIIKEASAQSERSASQVSALSNASVGSDDVFLSPPPHSDKGTVIHRDWDRQMKKRVESLERLLAEERLKVMTAEKKLLLVTQETVSTAMSDDSKLHLREKELLQQELIESQKHLKIATDQIKGLKERLHIMEEEHIRLKIDYSSICEQLDLLEHSFYDSDKTPEGNIEPDSSTPNVTKRLSPLKIPHRQSSIEAMSLDQKCAMYKLKAEELQYKVEEMNDIWRSKNAASEEEKLELEAELRQTKEDVRVMSIMLEKVKDELCEKEKVIAISETNINENLRAITRRDEIVQEQDMLLKQRDDDFRVILEQISNRDEGIRELREAVRNRDERLKEKDDILCKLNSSLDCKQRDVKMLSDKVKDCGSQLNEKEAVISVLQQQISHNTRRDNGSETDIEKENCRLKETLRMQQSDFNEIRHEKIKFAKDLETSRKALDEAMLLWDKDKAYFERTINVADEKVKLYETLPSMNKLEIEKAMKSDAHQYFQEKEILVCDIHNLKKEQELALKAVQEENSILQSEVVDKGRQLRQETEIQSKLRQDIERLSAQIDETRELTEDLRKKVQDLKEDLSAQDRTRTEIINKFATERSSWDIQRANLRSRINQMEEKLSLTSRAQTKAKDIHSHMELAWEKERTEQKRLLEEAHNLALDLQQQLKSRDEEYSKERRVLLQQLEVERQAYNKEKRERDIAMAEYESCGKRLVSLQKRCTELVLTHDEAREADLRERNDLYRRLSESKAAHSRDTKRVSDILSNLIRLRELGQLISKEKQEITLGTQAPWDYEAVSLDKTVLKYIKKALADIVATADMLSKHASTLQDDRSQIRRSLSSSEIDLIKEELTDIQREGSGVLVAKSRDSLDRPNTTYRLQKSSTFDNSTVSPLRDVASPTRYMFSRMTHSPFYSPGSKSAQASRSTSPSLSSSQRESLSPTPSVIPSSSSSCAARPTTLQKSVSMDSAPASHLLTSREHNTTTQSVSAGTTPTEQYAASQFSAIVPPPEDDASFSPPKVGSLDRLSPRSARRKFFEERPASEIGFLSWTERKQHNIVHHQKQSSLPDPSTVRKEAEEDYSLLARSDSPRTFNMKSSMSWDEKMHHRVVQTENSKSVTSKKYPEHSTDQSNTQPAKELSAKEKRRFFKKSSSMESHIGSSLAKMGTQVMPVAAPTGFIPTDILASVRSKFKLPFKKSSKISESVAPSPPTHDDSPDISPQLSQATTPFQDAQRSSTVVTAATAMTSQQQGDNRGRSRDSSTFGREPIRRTQSAERPLAASRKIARLHSEVITPSQVWQFSETAV